MNIGQFELERIISYLIDIAESERDFDTKSEIIREELINDFELDVLPFYK